jgi:hypothetical protein
MEGWWGDETLAHTLLFATGVSLGTLLVLSLYAYLATAIVRRSDRLAVYANRFVAFLFFLLGAQTLLHLLY